MMYPGRGAKLKPKERDRRIVEAWLDRQERRRSPEDVAAFYSWILEHQPDLVPAGPGAFGHVVKLIEPHVVEPKP